MIVRVESLRSLSRIIFGGGKSIEISILFEIYKCSRLLISHKSTLMAITSLKTIEHIYRCTDFFMTPEHLQEPQKLISGVLMTNVTTKVLRVRREITNLISLLLISNQLPSKPIKSDITRELRIQLFENESNFKPLNVPSSDLTPRPSRDLPRSSRERRSNYLKNDPTTFSSVNNLPGSNNIALENSTNAQAPISKFDNKDSQSLESFRDNNSEFFPAKSINLQNPTPKPQDLSSSLKKDSNQKNDSQDLDISGFSLVKSLRFLSSTFNKHSSSREERTAICEIYSSIINNMDSNMIESYYPILVNHIIIDLLGFTQVKVFNTRNNIINLNSLESNADNSAAKFSNSTQNLEINSTNLAIKSIANWILRVPIAQKLDPSAKFKALKYLKNFWIDGFYYYSSKASNAAKTETSASENKYGQLFIKKMKNSWDEIDFNDFHNISSIFKNYGESCLTSVLEEFRYLIEDVGTNSIDLNIFPLKKYKSDDQHYSEEDNNYSDFDIPESLNDFSDVSEKKNFKIIDEEVLINLLKSNADSIKLSACLCISSYLNQNPKLIAPIMEYLYKKIELRLALAFDDLNFFEKLSDSDIENKYVIKKVSNTYVDTHISSDHYSAAISFLQPGINELREGLSYAQTLSTLIANNVINNAFYTPLSLLDWVYEVAIKLLKNVYQINGPRVYQVESAFNSASNDIKNNLDFLFDSNDSNTSFQDNESRSKVFSTDPLGLNSFFGIPPENINHRSVTSTIIDHPGTHSVTYTSNTDTTKKSQIGAKKMIFLHIKRLSFCNLKLNIGWSLLSSFFSLIPEIYGVEWLRTKMECDWLPLWKKSLSQGKFISNTAILNSSLKDNTQNYFQDNKIIDSTIYHVYCTMPWSERAHLLQSRSLSLLHLSGFLKTLSSLQSTNPELPLHFALKGSIPRTLAKCIKNGLTFADTILDTPPPPKRGLDLGAIYGNSLLLSGSFESIEVSPGFYFINTPDFKNSSTDLHEAKKWSGLYVSGGYTTDYRAPQKLLPNSVAIGISHFDIRYHIVSCSISLALLRCDSNTTLAPLVLKMCLHLLTSSNNELDVYQIKQISSLKNAHSTASLINSELDDKNVNSLKLDKFEKPNYKPQWSYLSGFKSGSWGYESEVGGTSLLRKLFEYGSSVSCSDQEKSPYLSLAYGLNYGVDFNNHHFGSLYFSQWKNWCPEPRGYLNKLPIAPQNDSYNNAPLNEYISLVDISVQYFGLIFNSMEESAQLNLLQEMLNRMQRLPYNSHRQAAILTNFLSAMFSAAKTVQNNLNEDKNSSNLQSTGTSHASLNINRGSNTKTKLIPVKIASFMSDVARSALFVPSAAHRLLSSEILGLLALASENTAEYLSPLIERLTHQAIRSRDRFARAGTALALGSIYVHAGSIAASYHLQRVVVMLNSLANDSDPLVHMWALRALAEAAISAGFMFLKFGTDTLQMIAKLFMSDTHSYPFLGECQLTNVIRRLPLKSFIDSSNSYQPLDYYSSLKSTRNPKALIRNEPRASVPGKNDLASAKSNNDSSFQSSVALGHDAAIYHPNSITHKFENSDVDSNVNSSGSANLAMGLQSDWSRSCCEMDLDGFDSRQALARMLNALILALGPSIQQTPETFTLVTSFMREILKTTEEIGINVNIHRVSNSRDSNFKTLSLSSDSPPTKIFSVIQKIRYARAQPIPFGSKNSYDVVSNNNSKITNTLYLNPSVNLVFPFCDPDGTSSVLIECVQILQQQQMFFSNFSSQLDSRDTSFLYNDFYLDQIFLNQMRPILRCVKQVNGIYDLPIINGIMDLQIHTTKAMENMLRLYSDRILDNFLIYDQSNSHSGPSSSSLEQPIISDAKEWIKKNFTRSSCMYVALGWSWSDILFEALILHSNTYNHGINFAQSNLLIKNIDELSNTIISHVLNEERGDIISTFTLSNKLYGFSPLINSVASSDSNKSCTIHQANDSNTKPLEKFRILETINLLQVLSSFIIDKHQYISPKLIRKDLNFGQWSIESGESSPLSDFEWLSNIENSDAKFNLKNNIPNTNVEKYQEKFPQEFYKHANQFTQILSVNLITKILEETYNIIYEGTTMLQNESKNTFSNKNWNVHIFSHLISDLVTVAYISIKTPSSSKSPLSIAGFKLMSVIIKQFKQAPDIAILEKLGTNNFSKKINQFDISPILELYEAQIKSSIMPLIFSFEDEFISNDELFNTSSVNANSSKNFINRNSYRDAKGVPDEPIDYISSGLELLSDCIFSNIISDSRTLKRVLNVISIPIKFKFETNSKNHFNELPQLNAILNFELLNIWNKLIKFIYNFETNNHLFDSEWEKELYSNLKKPTYEIQNVLIKLFTDIVCDYSTLYTYQYHHNNLQNSTSKNKRSSTFYLQNLGMNPFYSLNSISDLKNFYFSYTNLRIPFQRIIIPSIESILFLAKISINNDGTNIFLPLGLSPELSKHRNNEAINSLISHLNSGYLSSPYRNCLYIKNFNNNNGLNIEVDEGESISNYNLSNSTFQFFTVLSILITNSLNPQHNQNYSGLSHAQTSMHSQLNIDFTTSSIFSYFYSKSNQVYNSNRSDNNKQRSLKAKYEKIDISSLALETLCILFDHYSEIDLAHLLFSTQPEDILNLTKVPSFASIIVNSIISPVLSKYSLHYSSKSSLLQILYSINITRSIFLSHDLLYYKDKSNNIKYVLEQWLFSSCDRNFSSSNSKPLEYDHLTLNMFGFISDHSSVDLMNILASILKIIEFSLPTLNISDNGDLKTDICSEHKDLHVEVYFSCLNLLLDISTKVLELFEISHSKVLLEISEYLLNIPLEALFSISSSYPGLFNFLSAFQASESFDINASIAILKKSSEEYFTNHYFPLFVRLYKNLTKVISCQKISQTSITPTDTLSTRSQTTKKFLDTIIYLYSNSIRSFTKCINENKKNISNSISMFWLLSTRLVTSLEAISESSSENSLLFENTLFALQKTIYLSLSDQIINSLDKLDINSIETCDVIGLEVLSTFASHFNQKQISKCLTETKYEKNIIYTFNRILKLLIRISCVSVDISYNSVAKSYDDQLFSIFSLSNELLVKILSEYSTEFIQSSISTLVISYLCLLKYCDNLDLFKSSNGSIKVIQDIEPDLGKKIKSKFSEFILNLAVTHNIYFKYAVQEIVRKEQDFISNPSYQSQLHNTQPMLIRKILEGVLRGEYKYNLV
ncbi:HEAT repeat-containing protein 5B [Smittium culicis]|uniref:HEAT repeat-containing protein 5B n=1 Tax=Smittium culicis TaxID=133412 RepID=A0A1R1Y6X0_9FUNG|nr:HEAT repeat-containing protein 5B [Smittium culicis]